MSGDVLVRAQSVQRGILILSNPSQPKYKNEHPSPASTINLISRVRCAVAKWRFSSSVIAASGGVSEANSCAPFF